MNCLISFIVPVYNAVDYVAECITSILGQTVSDFEILVVDDGSSDGSSLICDRFAEQDERVKVIHTENCGVSHARNTAIDLANGKYVVFVDADDLICPQLAEHIIKAFQSCGNVEMVCWKVFEFSESEIFFKKTVKRDISTENWKAIDILWRAIDDPQVAGYACNKAFLKSVLDSQKIHFWENIAVMEDLLFTCEYLKSCHSDSMVSLIDEKLYGYRQLQTSVSHVSFSEKKLSSLLARDEILQILTEAEIDSEKINQFRNQLLCALCIMNKKLIGYKGENKEYWQALIDSLWKKHSNQCLFDDTWTFKEKCYRILLQFASRFRMKRK